MIRFIFTSILILFFSTYGYATEKIIVFKYLHNDNYEVYVSKQDNCFHDKTMKAAIIHHLLRGYFSIDRIPSQYYNIQKQENILYFGYNVRQYIITPKTKDRFKSVLWLDNKDHIIKLEVYDNTDSMLMAFSGFDFIDGALHGSYDKETVKKGYDKQIHSDRRGNVIAKYRFWDTKEFYKGFRHFHTTVVSPNVFDLSFEDGINRFSIFVKPAEDKSSPISRIVYGNYLFSRVIDNMEYTVYGTISFGLMEEIVNIIHKDIKNILEIAGSGNIISWDKIKNR